MNRSKSEGAGHKARRYRERSNSNTEVKETMKVAITAKKVVMLLMAIALAVAMVACTGAATGPEGPQGEQGPPGPAAPTPEPADPAEPTTPEPAGPTGAAPMVSTPFEHVYLALEGTHNPGSKVIDLDMHITDSDSRVKFSAMSSDSMIATATPPEGGRTVTITPVRVGTATVTVEARDGDNPPTMADISVTVVRRNDRPTTNDLSKANRDSLEKPLYVNDGARPHTVTVAVTAGGTSAEEVEDEISDKFKVAYGDDKEKTSKYVSVSVAKHATAANKYVITVTPTEASWTTGSQKIFIYPMDMFGAASSEAWEFTAMFNKIPKRLVPRFDTIRLTRTKAPNAGDPGEVNTDNSRALYSVTVDGDRDAPDNVALIKIGDYFDIDSLERMRKDGVPLPAIYTDTGTAADDDPIVKAERDKIDEIGDTVCEVTVDTKLAVVQRLNEAGTGTALRDMQDGEPAANTDLTADTTTTANVRKILLRDSDQALGAIRIDSRYSSLGSDDIVNVGAFDDPPSSADAPKVDVIAKSEGAFDITIRCTDKDYTAEVTGTVVVQQGTADNEA